MAIIGINSVPTNPDVGSDTTSSVHYANSGGFLYTPSVAEQIFRAGMYEETDSTGASVIIAAYVMSGGVPTTLAGVSASISAAGSAGMRNTEAFTPIVLSVGVQYCVAMRVTSGTWNWMHDSDSYSNNAYSLSNLAGSSAFASTWTNNSQFHYARVFFMETQAVPGGGAVIPVHNLLRQQMSN